MECKGSFLLDNLQYALRIDLTRMECKAIDGSWTHTDANGIDLTRMECKVQKLLRMKSAGKRIDLTRMEYKANIVMPKYIDLIRK